MDLTGFQLIDRKTIDNDCALFRHQLMRQNFNKCRFTGAGRAHDKNELSFVDMNINVTERGVFCIVLQGHLIKRNH